MFLKKTRKEGGSTLLVIPRDYCRELHITPGDYLAVRSTHDGKLIITKVEVTHANERRTTPHPFRPNPGTGEPVPPRNE